MKYVVAIADGCMTNYIAEGKNYIVQGSSYVPFAGSIKEAKKYKTRELAEKASNRRGENMIGRKEIIEVEE